MALFSREMIHFTGHPSLSRFHCDTEFFTKYIKQSTSKKKSCQSRPYVKALHTTTKPNHFSSIKKTFNTTADSDFNYLNPMVLFLCLDAGK